MGKVVLTSRLSTSPGGSVARGGSSTVGDICKLCSSTMRKDRCRPQAKEHLRGNMQQQAETGSSWNSQGLKG